MVAKFGAIAPQTTNRIRTFSNRIRLSFAGLGLDS